MSHERSETVQRNGKWVNVYGRKTAFPGKLLPLKYPFEKPSYATVDEAVTAAEKRSKMEPDQGDPRDATWPFEYPTSRLPKGVQLSPSGDIGQHRQIEAKIVGGFKGIKTLSASSYFKKGRA